MGLTSVVCLASCSKQATHTPSRWQLQSRKTSRPSSRATAPSPVWCKNAALFTQEVRPHAIGGEIVATKFALLTTGCTCCSAEKQGSIAGNLSAGCPCQYQLVQQQPGRSQPTGAPCSGLRLGRPESAGPGACCQLVGDPIHVSRCQHAGIQGKKQ